MDPEQARWRKEIGYLDMVADDLEEALGLVLEARDKKIPRSVGLVANAADIYPALLESNVLPDVVTDQTPAHDFLMYVPTGSQQDCS